MNETITITQVKQMLCVAASALKEKQDTLTKIDGTFGDGDHGITMGKVADAMIKGCQNSEAETVAALCDDLGMDMLCINGGSASSLWGTMFQGLAESGAGAEMTAKDVKAFLRCGLTGLQDVSTAKVGDKTMMDALIPAVEAAESADDCIEEILTSAQNAAQAGMERTKDFVSHYGRAKSYGEKTIGTPDAGAVSMFYFFEGFLQGFHQLKEN